MSCALAEGGFIANELTWKITVDPAQATAALRQVRSEVAAATQANQNANKSELSTRQQLAAAQSLQRQRSAALIAEWKRSEKAAQDAARGVIPFRDSLQQLGNSMQTLRGSVAALEGPLGGIAGRLGSVSSLMGSLSSEATAAGGSIAAVAGPIGIAAAAMVGLTVAGVALSKQFLDLTLSTADWQGKLFDLSQQTGVSVETLSALEAVAETTGGSIESVAQSLVIFQGHLDDAQNSASKAGKLFTELGISTNNTEQAFRDALKALAAMPEGFKQTNDAAELFGRRGGKQVLAILKETQGDIDGTIEKLRALNSLVTTDVARGADQLNDQLKGTQRQFRGLQAQIVNESMPLIVKALQDLSRILRENRETFILLGQAIGLFLQGNLRLVAPAVAIASQAFEGHRRAALPLIEAYERLAAVMQLVTRSVPNVDANAIPAVGPSPVISFGGSATLGGGITRKKESGGGGGGGGSRTERVSEGQRLLNQLQEEHNRLTAKANDLSRVQIVELELLDGKYKKLSSSLRGQILEQAAQIDVAQKAADLDKRKEQATEKIRALLESQTKAIYDATHADKDWNAEVTALEAELKKLNLTMDEGTKKMLLDNAARLKAISLAQQLVDIEKQVADELDRESESLRELEHGQRTHLDTATAFIAKKIAEAEAVGGVTEKMREYFALLIQVAAKQDEIAAEEAGPKGKFRRAAKDAAKRAGEAGGWQEAEEAQEELSVWDAAIGALEDRIGSLQEPMKAFHDAAALYVVGAFHGMAEAAIDAVQAWILYGGSLGKALKQAMAAELAAIAARATIQAALHAAYAIGSLAFGNFAAAAQHGIAALKFAAVAAATGIAARGLAVSAAGAQSGSATAGSAFQSATQPRSQAGQPTTIDVNRRTAAQPAIHVTVRLQGDIATEALKTRVVDAVVESLDLNDARLTTQIQGAAQRGR